MISPAAPRETTSRRLDLREAWRSARRYPWLSFGVPLAVLASTGFFLWYMAPVYEAAATIRIDQERAGVAIVEALSELSSGSKITTEIEELRSRTLAEQVVDSLGLNLQVKRPRKVIRSALFTDVEVARRPTAARFELTRTRDGTFRVTADGRQAGLFAVGDVIRLPGATLVLTPGAARHEHIVLEIEPFGDAVRTFRDRLSVRRPNREADFVEVSFQHTDVELVETVPNLLAQLFIARRNSVRTQEARSTADFLEEQIASLNAQLTGTEEELRTFQERHGVLGIEAQGEAQVKRLAEMQADRELLDIERQSLQQVMSEMAAEPADPLQPSPFRALLGFPAILRNPAAGELLRTLNEAEAQRTALLDRATLDHWSVAPLTRHIQDIESQLAGLAGTYLRGLTEQVRGLDAALARFSTQLDQIPEQELHLARLRRQAGVTEELYTALQVRRKEAEIMAAIDDPTVRVIDPAIPPGDPVRPHVPLSLLLGLFAGVALGVGSAVAREQMDDTVRSRDDLQLITRVPVLGSIPSVHAAEANGGRLRSLHRPRVAANGSARTAAIMSEGATLPGVAEAYRSLRTNITFARPDHPPRTLVVTSPAPGDGKSTTAANLAITMAQQGRTCLLIDADMRRGRLHDLFEAPREPGLSNVLLGQVDLERAVHAPTGAGRPAFLGTGTIPPNPAELLGSARMGEVLASALGDFEVVILDAPPLNLVTDAAVLARHADGVLVVARAGVTQEAALSYTFEQLAAVKARVLGSILNGADPQRERHYGSYMQNYYLPD